MFSLCAVLALTVVTSSCVTPVHVLEVYNRPGPGPEGVSPGPDGVCPGPDGVCPGPDGVSPGPGPDGVSPGPGPDGVCPGPDGVSPGPDGVSPGPGPDGVSPGPGPDGVSPGPGPDGVSPGPGPDGVSPGPGPDGVSPGPGPDGVSHGPGPDGVSPGPDGVSPGPGPDGVSPGPDGVSPGPGPDGVSPGPDGVSPGPGPDGVSPGPDGVSPGPGPDGVCPGPGPDGVCPGPDGVSPGPDGVSPGPGPDGVCPGSGPDGVSPGPDGVSPGPDGVCPGPGPDGVSPGPDGVSPGPDGASPGPGPDGVCHSPDSFRSRWSFSNRTQDLDQFSLSCVKLIESFPLDEVDGNFVRTVKNCVFSRSVPTPLRGPLRLAAVSKDVIEGVLDLDLALTQSEDFLSWVSGRRLPPGSVPLAHRYGGHQFGVWAGQLGDGRAHSLGHFTNRKGEVWELQLKGSGKTPYSRSGDGRAVIRSSVREFLCSHAMFALGVSTSRAASLVVSEEPVVRDQFYDGNVKTERGAVVLRLAPSWFRFGSLEILTRSGELDLLRKLLNFVINEHFTSIKPEDPDKYLVFYSTVVNQTARLIAHWTSVGFAHGVCNTDNFSLLSITIDYGPFGFMEAYNPGFVPNWSDDEGRYRIRAQAQVGHFNLEKLLTALSPLLSDKQHTQAKTVLKGYADIYQSRIHQLFKEKLGILGDEDEDGFIIALLLKMMEDTHSDFTLTFRFLSEASEQQLLSRNFTQMWALKDLSSHELFSDWLSSYLLRLHRQKKHRDVDRQERMKSVNPRYVLRNWMAESAVRKAEKNDFSEVALLLRVLSSPFVLDAAAEAAGFAERAPDWSQRLKVSCSS